MIALMAVGSGCSSASGSTRRHAIRPTRAWPGPWKARGAGER
jgi:hypothetical protein